MSGQPHFLHSIFSDKVFTRPELELILSKFERVSFGRNAFLLRKGKTADKYWFLESGFLRSFAIDREGKDISTNFYTAGEIAIDWPSFFLRMPCQENIQALTDVVCWQLDYGSFQFLFHDIKAFREEGRSRLVNSFFTLKQRSIAMITGSAKDRYRKLIGEKPELVRSVPLKQLATYLGVTDTSLSRIRKEIASE